MLLQFIESLTVIFPELPEVPSELKMRIFVLAKLVERVVPVVSPPLGAIVKSGGSINQVPDAP